MRVVGKHLMGLLVVFSAALPNQAAACSCGGLQQYYHYLNVPNFGPTRRFLHFHQHVLQREMLLKMGHIRRWQELPYLKSITLTIDAQSDT